MGPALSPGQVGQEAAACAVLGACLGAVSYTHLTLPTKA